MILLVYAFHLPQHHYFKNDISLFNCIAGAFDDSNFKFYVKQWYEIHKLDPSLCIPL